MRRGHHRLIAALALLLALYVGDSTATAGAAEPPGAAGDADCDGSIGAGDAVAIMRHQFAGAALPCTALADLNCDGLIDLRDALEPLRYRAGLPPRAVAGCRPAGATGSIEFAGHIDPVAGTYGDLAAYGDFAYLGRFRNPCDGRGPAVIDISDPAHPAFAGDLPGQVNTSYEDVVVKEVTTPSFEGVLLATGLQSCHQPDRPAGRTGLELFDVTDPLSPAPLSFLDLAPAHGVHELDLFTSGSRAFALLAVPDSEVEDPQHQGDLRIIDITNPRNPVQIADWGIGADRGRAFGSPAYGSLGPPYDCAPPPGTPDYCRGTSARVYLHSVSACDNAAFLSYWDAGFITLDITTPETPRFLAQGETPPADDGDTHSAVCVPGRPLALTTDEDFSPLSRRVTGDTWGGLRIWDLLNPADPVQTATFHTPHALTNRNDGVFSVHNPTVGRDGKVYLSWYGDGVRILDIADPAAPAEVASYVTPAADIWGVQEHDGLVLASDVESGLWIFRYSGQ